MAKRKPIIADFNGITYNSLKEVAAVAEVNYFTLYDKVKKKNMTCDEAVAEIKQRQNKVKTSKTEVEVNPVEQQTLEVIDTREDIKDDPVKIMSDGELIEVEEFVCDSYGPTHIVVNNPKVIVDELRHMNIDHINLIDFENMIEYTEVINGYINKKNTLNIFFYHASIYSNNFFTVVRGCDNINLQVLIYKAKNELVDHLITYYLGALSTAYPEKRYNILSKDHVYYPFIESLGNPNIRGIGLNYISTKKDRYKYALCKYIINNKTLSHRNCIKDSEFEFLFKGFLQHNGDVTGDKVDNLYNFLIENELMEYIKKGSFVLYKFKMDSVNEFINKFK